MARQFVDLFQILGFLKAPSEDNINRGFSDSFPFSVFLWACLICLIFLFAHKKPQQNWFDSKNSETLAMRPHTERSEATTNHRALISVRFIYI